MDNRQNLMEEIMEKIVTAIFDQPNKLYIKRITDLIYNEVLRERLLVVSSSFNTETNEVIIC